MTNTKAGGAKYRETMIKKYGSYEKFVESMREVGRKGGSKLGVKKGFALDRERAVEAGRKGGTNGRGISKVRKRY